MGATPDNSHRHLSRKDVELKFNLFSPRKVFLYLWALPNTCLGLSVGLLSLVCGGGIISRHGVIGFTGKLIAVLFDRMPIQPIAMTLGHVVLARNRDCFLITLPHELVHVRQYERWGPLFIPAYLLCSLGARIRGADPYRDNPFEQEAFEKVPPHSTPRKDPDSP